MKRRTSFALLGSALMLPLVATGCGEQPAAPPVGGGAAGTDAAPPTVIDAKKDMPAGEDGPKLEPPKNELEKNEPAKPGP